VGTLFVPTRKVIGCGDMYKHPICRLSSCSLWPFITLLPICFKHMPQAANI